MDEPQTLNTAASGKPQPKVLLEQSQLWESLTSLFSLWYLSIILDLFAEALHSQTSSIRSSLRLKADPMTRLKANWRWGKGQENKEVLYTCTRDGALDDIILLGDLRVTKSKWEGPYVNQFNPFCPCI